MNNAINKILYKILVKNSLSHSLSAKGAGAQKSSTCTYVKREPREPTHVWRSHPHTSILGGGSGPSPVTSSIGD